MKHSLLILSLFLFFNSYGAKVDTLNVYSPAMHKNIRCVIIQPDLIENNEKFPVLYLLHGYSGSYKSWVNDFPSVKQDVDRYNFIVVCPDGGYSSWFFDSPVDSTFRYETFVAIELVQYVDRHYPTSADRLHRGISGLSMGGHGALFLALKHKNTFGAVASMSGGVDFRQFPDKWDIKKRLGTIAEHPENWERNTVINLVDSLKNRELTIAFDCGISDFFIQANRSLNSKLLQMGIEHDYTERPGGHTLAYWSNSIDYHLLFFFQFL